MYKQTCPICSQTFDQVETGRLGTCLMVAAGLWIEIYPCPSCYGKLMNSEFFDGDSLDVWYLELISRFLSV